MKEDREKCISSGMDDYISKPIEMGKFFEVIERLVSGKGRSKTDSEELPQRNEPAPIDSGAALTRCGGDRGLLDELIHEFMSYIPEQFEKLHKAVKSNNLQVVEGIAHTIKGSAGVLSMNSIAEASFKLEKMAREENMEGAKKAEGVKKAVKQLEIEFQHLCKYIGVGEAK